MATKLKAFMTLRRSITESAANTYTSDTLNTGIAPMSNDVFEVSDITLEHEGGRDAADVATLQITDTEENSMVSITDQDLIAKIKISGSNKISDINKATIIYPLVVKSLLYIGVQSTSELAATTYHVVITGNLRTLSDKDHRGLLAQAVV